MSACSHRKCRRSATQAYDVFSWLKEKRKQTDAPHYEVCDKHAGIFAGRFTDIESDKVRRDYEVVAREAAP